MGWFSKSKEESKGDKVILKIEGMTCGHCKARIENSLKNIRGVNSAEVYYDKSIVGIEQMKKVVEEIEIYKVVEEAWRIVMEKRFLR